MSGFSVSFSRPPPLPRVNQTSDGPLVLYFCFLSYRYKATKKRYAMILLVFIILYLYHAQACPSQCECDIPRTVSCKARGLHHFPPGVPHDTEELVMSNNPLGSLNSTQLSRFIFLKHLDISGCSIKVGLGFFGFIIADSIKTLLYCLILTHS